MAGITYKVRYKNHCTPQEQLVSNGRYYLDSDCGRKLTGDAGTSVTLAGDGTLTPGYLVTADAASIASNVDFIYIKNTQSTVVYISLTSDTTDQYVISLKEGEAFASEIETSANVRVKCLSGTSRIDYFSET